MMAHDQEGAVQPPDACLPGWQVVRAAQQAPRARSRHGTSVVLSAVLLYLRVLDVALRRAALLCSS